MEMEEWYVLTENTLSNRVFPRILGLPLLSRVSLLTLKGRKVKGTVVFIVGDGSYIMECDDGIGRLRDIRELTLLV